MYPKRISGGNCIAKYVQLAKTEVTTHLLTYRTTTFAGHHLRWLNTVLVPVFHSLFL